MSILINAGDQAKAPAARGGRGGPRGGRGGRGPGRDLLGEAGSFSAEATNGGGK